MKKKGCPKTRTSNVILLIPQTFVFRLKPHPEQPNFYQCVMFGFFKHEWVAKMYTTMSIFFLYGLPLIVIIICYTMVSVRVDLPAEKGSHDQEQAPR